MSRVIAKCLKIGNILQKRSTCGRRFEFIFEDTTREENQSGRSKVDRHLYYNNLVKYYVSIFPYNCQQTA